MNGDDTTILVLCSAAARRIAICTSLLPRDEGKAPTHIQLTPIGAFKPKDDRAAWSVPDAATVIAASQLPAPIDYDHGTFTGGSSRAAGWIEELNAKGPNGEPGIWGRVKWTDHGSAAIASGEYRYISPAFMHDEKTRVVTSIVGAGLTNNPALRDLPALASAQTQETDNLDPVAKIAAALGLAQGASLDDVLGAISGMSSGRTALCARLGKIATAAGLNIAGDKVGNDEEVAICAKLKAPAATGDVATLSAKVDELQSELVKLRSAGQVSNATATVDAAVKAGVLTPAERAWAIDYCSREPEKFAELMKVRPTILPSGQIVKTPPKDGAPVLTDNQLAICRLTGVTPETYAKTLKANETETA